MTGINNSPSEGNQSDKRLYIILLTCVILVLLGANVYWMTNDTTPPGWDQAAYLQTAAHFSDSLLSGGPVYLYQVFSRSLEVKAPLISLLPLPAFVLFGPGETTALLFMNFLVVLMAIFLFLLYQEVTDRRTALLGVILTSSMPIIFGLSRQFLVEYGLTVIVVMWMYFLITSDHLQNRKNNLVLGYLLGIGLLMKVTFPLYILAPSTIVFIQRLRINGFKEQKKLLMDLFMILLPGAVLASTWYTYNFSSVIRFGLSQGFGSPVEKYSLTLFQYWKGVINAGISACLLFSLVALAVLFVALRSRKIMNIFAAKETTYVLASWFVFPFLVLTLSVNSDVRFIAPALPVIGLVIAHLFFQVVRKKVVLLAVLFSAIPIFNFVYTTFPLGEMVIRLNDFSLISDRWGNQAYRPSEKNWHVTDVMAEINANARGQNKNVILLVDHAVYSAATFGYYKYLYKYPFEVANMVYVSPDATKEEIKQDLSQADYIVDKTGEWGPRGINYRIAEIRDDLMKGNEVFSLLKGYELPDGSRALLYKRN